MTDSNYRIELTGRVKFNGKFVKTFNAYKLIDGTWTYVGKFSAPLRTINGDLWKIAAERG